MDPADLIAVIGGGPAGALAAEILARHGKKVVVFDEKLAWEKPCGGGITQKALNQYEFLKDAAIERNMVGTCEFISPAGRRTTVPLNQPIAIFSRRVLNGMLLERARAAGAELRCERVVNIAGSGGNFSVRTPSTSLQAAFVVIAAGARNPFRAQFYEPFAASDLMATVGYYIPGSSSSLQVRFVKGLDGYIWTFPRRDHYSAGICGRMTEVPTSELRRHLERFLAEEKLPLDEARIYAHVLPAPRASTLRSIQPVGDGWAMIGDAAGYVDPITGEGLYYALRSADLLAQALLADRPESYRDLVERDFLPELIEGAQYAERFYHGTFLGEHILERIVQFAEESERFRLLLCDLFSGAQGYIGLRARASRTLPRMLREFVISVGGRYSFKSA
ncbi:MAG TPA: FAD-dependent monooxygenase [Terriglobales bacterium]|nr:FAD-dependent monooxygenase [Terriglobales bacterium]